MSSTIKSLIVVLALSGIVFALGKHVALHFMEEQDFRRRRNIWLVLTAAAFLCTNFWLFVLIAAPLLLWGGRKDTNPLAFYLLLMNVIPSIPVPIPSTLVRTLFDVDIFRLLSLCVLVPAAWRLRKSATLERSRTGRSTDLFILAYGALQLALYVRPDIPDPSVLHDSFTAMLRRGFLFFIDQYVIYFVASRLCTTRRAISDSMSAFCLSATLLAALALFESVKRWLLYSPLIVQWHGDPMALAYSLRAGLLRAEASSSNPLVLGVLLSTAFGFWLYLQTEVTSRLKHAVTAVLLGGLVVSFSRGPWIAAVLIYLAFSATGPKALARLAKACAVMAVLFAIVASPLGDRVSSVLPFMGGSVAKGSVIYRERLFQRSLELIQEHPVLGDQFALLKMQDLRQGQGIIDVVNTYLSLALFNGFLGLFLFVGFIVSGLFKAYRASRELRPLGPEYSLLGTALVAAILGLLVSLGDCSFILGCVPIFFSLAGLSIGYARLASLPSTHTALSPSLVQ